MASDNKGDTIVNSNPAQPSFEDIRTVLQTVIDPEVGMSIVDLGLIEAMEWTKPSFLLVKLIMTSPTCPLGNFIALEVKRVIAKHFPDIAHIQVDVLKEPHWTSERMAEGVRPNSKTKKEGGH